MTRSGYWIVSIFIFGTCWGAPPSSYDLRTQYSRCQGFVHIYDQASCSSCCAAAVATQLSLRRCMSTGDMDGLFSAQQVWDCAGSTAGGTCANGVVLDRMVEIIGTGSRSGRGLVDRRCGLPFESIDPNITRCLADDGGPCSPTDRVGGVARYDLAPYFVGIEYASQLASRALMNEIFDNGPVVAVLTFVSTSDFDNFASAGFLKQGRVFMPNVTTWSFLKRHCVVVVGWGTDAASGHPFWIVQNSYGVGWADGGFARVLRGADMLEGEWRGLFLANQSVAPNASSLAVVVSYLVPSTDILLPSSDIVLVTFLTAIVLAGLIVTLTMPKSHCLTQT